jgi:hypothetical protein
VPSFLTPLHEANDCHLPAGSPEGGRFGAAGECFANVNRWSPAHGEAGDTVVHGKVTNVEGKTFDHAWVERGDTVIDPTAGTTMPKARYYAVMQAEPESRYTPTEAIRNMIRAKHHGPWTAEDLRPPRETMAAKRTSRAAGASRMALASGGERGRLERERLDRLAKGRATQKMIRAIRRQDK